MFLLMKKFLFSLITFVTVNGPLTAVLPPLWEGVAEIKAILNDSKLGELLGAGELIDQIIKTESGWIVLTNKHELEIKVVYQPQEMPGPAHFTLEFGQPLPAVE